MEQVLRNKRGKRLLTDEEARKRGLVKVWNAKTQSYTWNMPRSAQFVKVPFKAGDAVEVFPIREFGTVLYASWNQRKHHATVLVRLDNGKEFYVNDLENLEKV